MGLIMSRLQVIYHEIGVFSQTFGNDQVTLQKVPPPKKLEHTWVGIFHREWIDDD